jgi:AMMECR1 domain-containing protein
MAHKLLKQLFAFVILLSFILLNCSLIYGTDILDLFRNNKNTLLEKEICSLAREAVTTYLKDDITIKAPVFVSDVLKKTAPVFVTIVENGKVRGCMGTIQPATGNAASEIIRSAIMAATKDPWNKPLEIHEIKQVKFIVSIPGKMRRVENSAQLAPQRLGLLVRRDSRSALLLPGEALTADWQLFQCKRKAGISQNEPVEMFVFETVTFGPY